MYAVRIGPMILRTARFLCALYAEICVNATAAKTSIDYPIVCCAHAHDTRANSHLKAMSHDATFPATCLATLTTALRCKLQRGCHTLATFAATCNFICPRNHFVCPRNSLINSRKFDLCQVSPPRLASVNLSDGRREPASESKEHFNVFGTGSRTGGRDPEEEKAEKHLDDTVGCSKRGERLFPPGKQQHTLTQL